MNANRAFRVGGFALFVLLTSVHGGACIAQNVASGDREYDC